MLKRFESLYVLFSLGGLHCQILTTSQYQINTKFFLFKKNSGRIMKGIVSCMLKDIS